MDVAYCCHNDSARERLLTIMSDPYIRFDDIVLKCQYTNVNDALVWIGKRKINVLSLATIFQSIDEDYQNIVSILKH